MMEELHICLLYKKILVNIVTICLIYDVINTKYNDIKKRTQSYWIMDKGQRASAIVLM